MNKDFSKLSKGLSIPYSEENCKLFCHCLKQIMTQEKEDDEFDEMMKKHSFLGDGFLYDYSKVTVTLIGLLECFLPDSDNGKSSAVDWFLYEREDINGISNVSTEIDGKTVEYCLKTPEDLYYFEWGKDEKLKKCVVKD